MIYMSKNKLLISLLFALLLLSGCGGYKQTNTQTRDVAFLKFNKSMFKSYSVIVNDKYRFTLDACAEEDNTGQGHDDAGEKLYEITSGNTVIKVFDKNDNLVLKKEMYLGSSNTMEINLP